MTILYLGDNAGTSAEYLKDILAELDHTTEHVDAKSNVPSMEQPYDVIIASDYPAKQLKLEVANQITEQINNGSRFIMLGGWDSYNGRGSNYYNHPLAKILPVVLQSDDDRVNAPQGLVLRKTDALSVDLPIDWHNPPVICGYNSVEIKPNVSKLVEACPISTNGETISLLQPQPLVVRGTYGKGVTVACMTDLAPHWCGGLVDWGSERVALQHVEVGDMYIQFVRLLLESS